MFVCIDLRIVDKENVDFFDFYVWICFYKKCVPFYKKTGTTELKWKYNNLRQTFKREAFLSFLWASVMY